MIPVYILNEISFSYGGPPVLEVDHLEIFQGQIVALLGPNGSGKTTLLHVLAFLETPQRGCIDFFGEKHSEKNLLEFRRRVGLLLQNPYLFRETVMSNMVWGLRLRGIFGQEARRVCLEALELVGLSGFQNRYARSLSGGESQRVALARALVLKPSVLLLDEPSNHMDRASAQRVEEIVRELNRDHGITVIIATHVMDRVQSLAHRMIHLWQGKVTVAAPENFFHGVPRNEGFIFDTGRISFHLKTPAPIGSVLTVEPTGIEIHRSAPNPETMNAFQGTIVAMAVENGKVRVDVKAGESFRVLVPLDHPIISEMRIGEKVSLLLKENAVKFI